MLLHKEDPPFPCLGFLVIANNKQVFDDDGFAWIFSKFVLLMELNKSRRIAEYKAWL